jgi:predicted ATPase with chaperone activity
VPSQFSTEIASAEWQQQDAPTPQRSKRFTPPELYTLADTGLPQSLIEQLLLKFLYFKGDLAGNELARAAGFRFSIIEDLVEDFRAQQLVQVKGSRGLGPVSSTLSLTEQGRRVTRDYLEGNQYVGPAPVPLAQYATAVGIQKLPNNWLSFERLSEAYAHMVVSDRVLDQIGPAVSSGKSFLIYGQPGNGKTYLAESLANIQTSPIWIPFALECQGNIIQLFDPSYHTPLAGENAEPTLEIMSDGRWARCKRPFLATGGELTLGMLDLSFNSVTKVYDAPFHLKANNGIYLIDDFGRQRATPTEILNRWIVPMERHVDYLGFAHGGKMTVPFETFLVFSTNLTPDKLGDEAFLRRIQYKMLLRSPDKAEFRAIFLQQCEKHGFNPTGELIDQFILKHYTRTGRKFRRCHPRDVISQATDYIAFKRMPNVLTEDLLDHAFECCFSSSEDLSET